MFKMPNLKGITKVITAFAKVHSPELLVGLGLAGMATSTILAVKATPKAVEKINTAIDDENAELMDIAVRNHQEVFSPVVKLKTGDVVKLCYKDYLPAAITGVAGIICVIGGTHINLRRNAALVTAVKLSEVTIKDLQDYKNKVVETIGEEKSDEIEAKVNENIVQKAALSLDGMIISGSGPILCFDKVGGQWFKSDKESIRSVINDLNFRLNDEMYVSLNDLYYGLGMEQTIAGRSLGWNRDQGLIEPHFSSHLLSNGTPVMVFTTRVEPRANYERLY